MSEKVDPIPVREHADEVHAIGDVFEWEDVTLRVEQWSAPHDVCANQCNHCNDCHLISHDCDFPSLECRASYREDGNYIIFVAVSEPKPTTTDHCGSTVTAVEPETPTVPPSSDVASIREKVEELMPNIDACAAQHARQQVCSKLLAFIDALPSEAGESERIADLRSQRDNAHESVREMAGKWERAKQQLTATRTEWHKDAVQLTADKCELNKQLADSKERIRVLYCDTRDEIADLRKQLAAERTDSQTVCESNDDLQEKSEDMHSQIRSLRNSVRAAQRHAAEAEARGVAKGKRSMQIRVLDYVKGVRCHRERHRWGPMVVCDKILTKFALPEPIPEPTMNHDAAMKAVVAGKRARLSDFPEGSYVHHPGGYRDVFMYHHGTGGPDVPWTTSPYSRDAEDWVIVAKEVSDE